MIPGGLQDSVTYTLLASDGSRAVFNAPEDDDYIGFARFTGLDDSEVREVADDRPEADGGVHGNFWRGRRPVVANIEIVPTSVEDRNQRYDKLMRTLRLALREDLTLTFAPAGSVEQFIRVRKQGPVRRAEEPGWVTKLQVPLVSADSFKYSTELHTLAVEFDPLTLAEFETAVLAQSPALYWKLNTADGATDQSGNGRNGTAQGGLTFGGGAALTNLTGGDSSTNFDGTDDFISSTYAPFATGGKRTFFGLAVRDTNTTEDGLFGNATLVAEGLKLGDNSQQIKFRPNDVDVDPTGWQWPGNAQTVGWAITFDPAAPTGQQAQFFINGNDAGFDGHGSALNWSGSGNLRLGRHETAGYFDGQMAHFMVFEHILTANEIAELYELATRGERVVS